MKYEVRVQNADLRHTRAVLDPIGMNHRQSTIRQIEHPGGSVRCGHGERLTKLGIDLNELGLKSAIGLCLEVDVHWGNVWGWGAPEQQKAK